MNTLYSGGKMNVKMNDFILVKLEALLHQFRNAY